MVQGKGTAARGGELERGSGSVEEHSGVGGGWGGGGEWGWGVPSQHGGDDGKLSCV